MEPVFTLRVSSLIQKQRHRDTAQQDTEHCRIQSTAALQHTAGAGGGPLVEIWLSESHLTAQHRLGTCHQWGPQLSVATCVTTRPSPLHTATADTNICSNLGPSACSTLKHSAAQHRSAQVHCAQLTAPHRTEHCTHPHHCTVPHCTALYMCGEEMCFVFIVHDGQIFVPA